MIKNLYIIVASNSIEFQKRRKQKKKYFPIKIHPNQFSYHFHINKCLMHFINLRASLKYQNSFHWPNFYLHCMRFFFCLAKWDGVLVFKLLLVWCRLAFSWDYFIDLRHSIILNEEQFSSWKTNEKR